MGAKSASIRNTLAPIHKHPPLLDGQLRVPGQMTSLSQSQLGLIGMSAYEINYFKT